MVHYGALLTLTEPRRERRSSTPTTASNTGVIRARRFLDPRARPGTRLFTSRPPSACPGGSELSAATRTEWARGSTR